MSTSSKPHRILCPLLAFAALILACSVSPADEPKTPPVLLQMIRDSSIHDELRLSEVQRSRVIESLRAVDGRWFRSRNLPADPQRQEIESF